REEHPSTLWVERRCPAMLPEKTRPLPILLGDDEQGPRDRHAVDRGVIAIGEREPQRVVVRRRVAAVAVDGRSMVPDRTIHGGDVFARAAQRKLEDRREFLGADGIPA